MNGHRLRKSVYGSLCGLMISVIFFLILVLLIRQPFVQDLDNRLITLLDPIRTDGIITFFSGLTTFGSSKLLIPLIACCMIFLILKRHFVSFILLPLFFGLERLFNGILKNWIQRDRPDFAQLVTESGYSFPSGHTMNAAAVYGLLLLFVTPLIQTKWLRTLWMVSCWAFILLIGFSRPFLRVHFFTDILAGYAAGAFVVTLAAMASLLLRRLMVRRH